MSHHKLDLTQAAKRGFTIVELIVVVVVIAILASVVIVSYNGIRERANDSAVKAAISQLSRQLGIYNVDNNHYPNDITNIAKDSSLIYQYTYTAGSNSYCLSVSGKQSEYFISNDNTSPQAGVCPGHTNHVAIVTAPPPPQWSAIATGSNHSCGIYNEKAYCWGDNTNGRLGDGTTTSSLTPVAVKTTLMSGPVTHIATGSSHSCAIAGGVAYCWGANSNGRLGNGSTTASSEPVAVNTSIMSGTVTDIAAGGSHSCAVANNAAYCWGSDSAGQLGNSAGTSTTTPLAVATSIMSGSVTKIATGYQHSCAIAAGNAYCWGGYSGYGILGNGTSGTSITPVAVLTTTMPAGSVTSIATGSEAYHNCAVSAARAYCWGNNNFGKLGDATTVTKSSPVAVVTTLMSGDIASVTVGGSHSCAVRSNGSAFCWGGNTSAQLGDGGTSSSSSPKAVLSTNISGSLLNISAGAGQTCTYSTEHAYCWGQNGSGQLGNGSTTQALSAVEAIVTP